MKTAKNLTFSIFVSVCIGLIIIWVVRYLPIKEFYQGYWAGLFIGLIYVTVYSFANKTD